MIDLKVSSRRSITRWAAVTSLLKALRWAFMASSSASSWSLGVARQATSSSTRWFKDPEQACGICFVSWCPPIRVLLHTCSLSSSTDNVSSNLLLWTLCAVNCLMTFQRPWKRVSSPQKVKGFSIEIQDVLVVIMPWKASIVTVPMSFWILGRTSFLLWSVHTPFFARPGAALTR